MAPLGNVGTAILWSAVFVHAPSAYVLATLYDRGVLAKTDLLVIKATLAEIMEYLGAEAPGEEVRAWTARAERYARMVDSWERLGSTDVQVARTLEGVMDLHAQVLKACRRITIAAPPPEPDPD
jgi:hypothetical protein